MSSAIRTVHSIKPLSNYRKEAYTCSKVDIHTQIMNVYLICKQIPTFEDKLWDDNADIFDVAEWLHEFIRLNSDSFVFNEDYTCLARYKKLDIIDDFICFPINWIYKIEDNNLKELCLDAVYFLIKKTKWNTFNESENRFSYRDIFLDEISSLHYELEKSDEEYHAELQYNIEMLEEAISDYDDIEHRFLEFIISRENSSYQDFEYRLKEYYKNRIVNIYTRFAKECYKIIESEIDFSKFYNADDECLNANDASTIFWDFDGMYFSKVSDYINEIANSVGVSDFYSMDILTKESFNSTTIKDQTIRSIKKLRSIYFEYHESTLVKFSDNKDKA